MAEDVGGIVWTADINTQRLTRAERQIDRSAGRVERRFGSVESSADRAGFAVRRMAAGISAALAVRQVTAYADAWTNVQNQLRVVTDSQEELADVSDRIVTIARETRASLEGTSQLYSRFRRGVDDTVASDEQLLGVTRTINQTLAISGATAAEAEGALRQLAQGIASGTLRGEEFNSVSEQAPGILRAVSQETGMTVGALREFAAQGGITSELLITSLENYAETAEREFAGSTRSMSASLEVARTNAIEFVGATQGITKAVGAAGDGIVFLSENLDTLVQLATVGAAVFGARFVGAMAAATAAYVANTAAAFDASTESQRAARAKLTEIAAEVEFLRVTQASLSAQLAGNTSTARAAGLRAQLASNTAALTAATRSYAAAQATANGATAAGTAVMRGLRGVMGLLGGPGGVIFLAAAGLYAYATRADEAKSANEVLSQSTDDLTKAKARLAQLDAEQTLEAERERLAELERQIENATVRWREFGEGSNSNKRAQRELGEEIRRMRAELAAGTEDAEALEVRLGELANIIAGETGPGMDDLAGKASDAGAAIRSVAEDIAWAQEKVRAGVGGNEDPFDIPEAPDAPDEPDPGALGLTDLQALEEQYAKERQMLLDAQQAGIDSKVSYEQRLTELQRQYSEQRRQLIEGEKTGMMAALEQVGFSFDSLANRGVGALAQVATRMQSGSDAAKQFAQTMLTDLLGALIRIGFQAVASTLMASTAEQTAKTTSVATTAAAMAATTAATTAAAGVTAAAWTLPATLASIATLGGAAATGTAALASAVAAGQAISAAGQATGNLASVGANLFGSGRLYGGPVNPGTMYPVNEDGRPEMLVQNGRQYLLPGARGEVVGNREMTQNNSGGNVTIQQHINASEAMDAQRFRNMVYDANVSPAIVSVVERHLAKRGKRL